MTQEKNICDDFVENKNQTKYLMILENQAHQYIFNNFTPGINIPRERKTKIYIKYYK